MTLHKLSGLRCLHVPMAANALDNAVLSTFACLTLLEDLQLCNVQARTHLCSTQ